MACKRSAVRSRLAPPKYLTMIKQMKKLLALILLIALVGCAEYGSYAECNLKERTKFTKELSHDDEMAIYRFCLDFKSSSEMIVP